MTAPTLPPLPPLQSVHIASHVPGPKLLVTGGVHGNEVCGTLAIRRVLAELDAGTLVIRRGSVSFVPVCNPLAFQRGQRGGDRNLNRALEPKPAPQDNEDRLANWLCPILAAHDGLLDLHSFHSGGAPFVMVGPHDNAGPLEPFAQAAVEEGLARVLGVPRAVDGWLGTYADGVAQRRAQALADGLAPESLPELHPRYGVGTTEYMRSQGGWALTLECGEHTSPAAVDVAWQAIHRTLAHLGLIDAPPPAPVAGMQCMRLFTVVDRQHADDRFVRDWQSFDPVRAGEAIGHRADGSAVCAPDDGWIVFPNTRAGARQEWFYLARASRRFATD
ncbi:MAG TPA: succinylglutamate desuccinylase/aspartoacylase family protein [Aquabacterium sp.]|nr:succinylglutamate desuccinylase/aspartoacylase family protein [Aquabacterium sp.]HQC97007.1 succinylglutamate desuccinylase/aspartoacylase family protein [Aquabacterium sp.]